MPSSVDSPDFGFGYGYDGNPSNVFGIDHWYVEEGEKGIRQYISDNCLTDSGSQRDRNLDAGIKHATGKDTGSDPSSTATAYKSILNEMLLISYLIGDYRSATLLNARLCPSNPHPLKPELIGTYLKFKCGEDGDLVRVANKTTPVRAIGRRALAICSSGTWNAPTCINIMLGAVRALESLYDGMSADYSEACANCWRMSGLKPGGKLTLRPWKSCPPHAWSPSIVPRGSVMRSLIASKAKHD
eukprot:Pompholyxophrys_punicea_v1_NODE_572_length_1672_cov_2.459493.p2 type:complete len:243 gc:universal NODE_572_length_1672_cov_2.459493:1585-857(-)